MAPGTLGLTWAQQAALHLCPRVTVLGGRQQHGPDTPSLGRHGQKDDPKLMQEWFKLVQEKNAYGALTSRS